MLGRGAKNVVFKTRGKKNDMPMIQPGTQKEGVGEMPHKEMNYSAKKARKGMDIGKPGKNFTKIAASAGKKYGSKAAGQRVAGAILAKLRRKHA